MDNLKVLSLLTLASYIFSYFGITELAVFSSILLILVIYVRVIKKIKVELYDDAIVVETDEIVSEFLLKDVVRITSYQNLFQSLFDVYSIEIYVKRMRTPIVIKNVKKGYQLASIFNLVKSKGKKR